jgi:hypothetical protein
MTLATSVTSAAGASVPGLPAGAVGPYDWALAQLRVPEAHRITRGDPNVVVAVIDLGYRPHPDHEGHLWVNPRPTRGDVHGWDFADDDATLEYTGHDADTSDYFRGHHAFVVGEVAAVAPRCPIMVLRVGYQPHHKGGWERAVRYAVDHGAKVLVIPHGYIPLDPVTGVPLFYQGTDFGYLIDNHGLVDALDHAYRSGCLVFAGTADNRGRRVAAVNAALESVVAVGSSNRAGVAADIACSADYTEVAAPGGQRESADSLDKVWGTGGDHNYIPFEGGCMASSFAAGVAALAMSRYRNLSSVEVRQLLRNTAQGQGWDPYLGHGILDAAAAVSVPPEQLRKTVRIVGGRVLPTGDGAAEVEVELANDGVLDAGRVLAVAFDGDPLTAADRAATLQRPHILLRRQLGHAIGSVVGLERSTVRIPIVAPRGPHGEREVHVQASVLDVGSAGAFDTALIAP